MTDTIIVQQRWPRRLADGMKHLAEERHTTVSELTRQALIDHYLLPAGDVNPAKDDTSSVRGESNGRK